MYAGSGGEALITLQNSGSFTVTKYWTQATIHSTGTETETPKSETIQNATPEEIIHAIKWADDLI